MLVLASIGIAAFGWLVARAFYYSDPSFARARAWATRFSFVHRTLQNKYYVDELYNRVFVGGTLALSRLLAWIDTWIIDGLVNLVRHLTVVPLGHGSNLFDRFVVDGLVNGVALGARGGSRFFRRLQSGFVQNYALVMGAGIVLITVVYLFTKP